MNDFAWINCRNNIILYKPIEIYIPISIDRCRKFVSLYKELTWIKKQLSRTEADQLDYYWRRVPKNLINNGPDPLMKIDGFNVNIIKKDYPSIKLFNPTILDNYKNNLPISLLIPSMKGKLLKIFLRNYLVPFNDIAYERGEC